MTDCTVCHHYIQQANACQLFNLRLAQQGATDSCDIHNSIRQEEPNEDT